MANCLICSKLWLKLKRYLCFEILNDKAIFLNESNNLLITILQTGLSFWVSPRLSSANLSRCARSTRASSSWTCNDFREERNGEKITTIDDQAGKDGNLKDGKDHRCQIILIFSITLCSKRNRRTHDKHVVAIRHVSMPYVCHIPCEHMWPHANTNHGHGGCDRTHYLKSVEF